ncbi:uncharacterized protein LAESUDRAFT_762954 [Laetiporus sulphureus 93-53]|uniref:SWIM-type domain-containing protein n=1 Tax=Laetiporus sulphureus 93-53 TaxID=1314785 RepID=A0A165C8K0_9APHY|nr:uncharacterized protein LAESUDRAFT_762954 [Laetiporus sulphureus 93-53]KZT02390.1 hypothetical protein LAESUDRAFT_762954 [Laetiporus sulphureus 93-53]
MPKRKAVEDEHDALVPPRPARSRPSHSSGYTYSSSHTAAYPTANVASSSSHPIACGDLDIAPPKKKARKKKDSDASPVEKRGAMFRKKCLKSILERFDRVMRQRFYMVDRRRNDDELKEEFSVLGSTGNVYTVTIDRKPSCDCPDAKKGNHCKHIIFIFLKVLQVTPQSGFWYQKALLTSELQHIFTHAPPSPAAVTNARAQKAFAVATGKASPSSADQNPKKRIPGEEDDCPICYDKMHGTAEAKLEFCEECGNALHKECFQQWAATARQHQKELTCVFCRAKWVIAGAAAGTSADAAEGYINLGSVAGMSPVRDTSTYHNRYWRGKRR